MKIRQLIQELQKKMDEEIRKQGRKVEKKKYFDMLLGKFMKKRREKIGTGNVTNGDTVRGAKVTLGLNWMVR